MIDLSNLMQPAVSGTDTDSAAFSVDPQRFRKGGGVTLAAKGTFSSTTIKLQGSMDGTNFFDIANMSLSAAGALFTQVALPYYKVAVTAGSGTGLAYAVY